MIFMYLLTPGDISFAESLDLKISLAVIILMEDLTSFININSARWSKAVAPVLGLA